MKKDEFIEKGSNCTFMELKFESAGCYNNGKDKRGEKLVETDEDRLENRTDFSDAFDTVCIGVDKFPQTVLYTGGMSNYYPR